MEASGVGAMRHRPHPSSGAQDQQNGLQTAAARWRLAAGIGFSRSKQTPIHKPLRPRACPSTPSARALSTRASSKRTIVVDGTKQHKKPAAQLPDDNPRPRSILDPAQAVTLEQQEVPSMALSNNAVTPKPVKGVAATTARGRRSSAGGADLILIGGRFGSTALPRSGSAPSTCPIMLTKYPANISESSSVQHQEKNRVPRLGGAKKGGILEAGPSPAPTTLSCWDESGDASIALVEATTPSQRHGAARSWDGQVANSAAVSQNGDKDTLPQWTATSASSAGWKDAPLAAQHDDALGKSAGKRKQLLSPLRRRESDVTDTSKRVHTARVEAASAAPQTACGGRRISDGTLQTPSLSQAKSGRLLRGDTVTDVVRVGQEPLEARQRDAIQNLRASRPSTHAGRWGASSSRLLRSQADSDERVGQGQLKARTRVMEWKRRQSDGLKANLEEVATLEQKERAEAALEAARKLAATRAEEAERRLMAERENAAGVGRAADVAEKWAKHSLERRRRRAEIYAINAIMSWSTSSGETPGDEGAGPSTAVKPHAPFAPGPLSISCEPPAPSVPRAAFEKDFKAYSLEKERQAQEASPMTS